MIENLPIEIQNRIKEYIPRDRDMFSPTSFCMKPLIEDYEDDTFWVEVGGARHYLSFKSYVFIFPLSAFESEWNGIRGSFNRRSL